MSATRTQVYFTGEQRRRLDDKARRDRKALAEVYREALDAYVPDAPADLERTLDETFGSMPDLNVPARDEWDRRYG